MTTHPSPEPTRRPSRSRSTPTCRARRRPAFDRLEARRLLSTIVWDGDGDGTSFAEGSNWQGGVEPGPSDIAMINVSAGVDIMLPAGGVSVGSIDQTGGTLTLSSGTFTEGQESSLTDGTFEFEGGSISEGKYYYSWGLFGSTLDLGVNSGPATFALYQTCTLNGTIGPAQEIDLIANPDDGSATLTVDSGFTNLGFLDFYHDGDSSVPDLECELMLDGSASFTNAGNMAFLDQYGLGTISFDCNIINQRHISFTNNLSLESGDSLINEGGGGSSTCFL